MEYILGFVFVKIQFSNKYFRNLVMRYARAGASSFTNKPYPEDADSWEDMVAPIKNNLKNKTDFTLTAEAEESTENVKTKEKVTPNNQMLKTSPKNKRKILENGMLNKHVKKHVRTSSGNFSIGSMNIKKTISANNSKKTYDSSKSSDSSDSDSNNSNDISIIHQKQKIVNSQKSEKSVVGAPNSSNDSDDSDSDSEITSKNSHNGNQSKHKNISSDTSDSSESEDNLPLNKKSQSENKINKIKQNKNTPNSKKNKLKNGEPRKCVRFGKHVISIEANEEIKRLQKKWKSEGKSEKDIEDAIKLVARRDEKKRKHQKKKMVRV